MVNLYIPTTIAKMTTWKFYVVLLDTQTLQTHFNGFFRSPSMALHNIHLVRRAKQQIIMQ